MHVVSQAKALEYPDKVARDIELPPVYCCESRAWESMMIVMPALTKTQKCRDPLVATLIRCLELALTKDMADGIGAESNMVHQEDPHQAGPQEPGPSTDQKWDHK